MSRRASPTKAQKALVIEGIPTVYSMGLHKKFADYVDKFVNLERSCSDADEECNIKVTYVPLSPDAFLALNGQKQSGGWTLRLKSVPLDYEHWHIETQNVASSDEESPSAVEDIYEMINKLSRSELKEVYSYVKRRLA